jgi:hypothetical protein
MCQIKYIEAEKVIYRPRKVEAPLHERLCGNLLVTFNAKLPMIANEKSLSDLQGEAECDAESDVTNALFDNEKDEVEFDNSAYETQLGDVINLEFPSGLAEHDCNDTSAKRDLIKPRYKNFGLPPVASLNVEVGRNIGYDYAIIGLPHPIDAPASIREGFVTARHKKHHRSHEIDLFQKKILRLRYSAWRRNRIFDENVTAAYLRSLYREICPITRIHMTHGTGTDTDASVERVFNDSAYAVGNLMFMSARANKAKANRTLAELAAIALSGEDVEGLSNIAWKRLACVANFMQPEISKMMLIPMTLCPPSRLVINNPATLLQDSLSMIACGQESQKLLGKFRALTSGKTGKRALIDTVDMLYGLIRQAISAQSTRRVEWAVEDAWLQEKVFELFSAWYSTLTPQQINSMMHVNRQMRSRVIERAEDQELGNWSIDTRGYDRTEDIQASVFLKDANLI